MGSYISYPTSQIFLPIYNLLYERIIGCRGCGLMIKLRVYYVLCKEKKAHLILLCVVNIKGPPFYIIAADVL